MTTPVSGLAVPRSPTIVGVALVAAVGCGALAARPALLAPADRPAVALLFGVLLVVGASAPLPRRVFAPVRASRLVVTATLLGVGAFAIGRVLIGGHAPTQATLAAI